MVGRLVGVLDARLLVAIGFGFLALSGLWLSWLTFDVAWSNIAFVTFLNGLANPLIFIALSTMSFGTLRREQMGGATGIYNLMRNLGGSVGISVATTLLSRRAQVHQNVLVARMTPYDPVYQQKLESIRQALIPKVGPYLARPAGGGHPLQDAGGAGDPARLRGQLPVDHGARDLQRAAGAAAEAGPRARHAGRALSARRDRYREAAGGGGGWNFEASASAPRDCTPSRRWLPIVQVGNAFTPAFSQRSGRALTPLGSHST